MTTDVWRDRLEAFFELRAQQIESKPSMDDLCYIAGRSPALWADPVLRDDLRNSILGLLHANSESTVLEVGCAAGFLSHLIAPSVKEYVGVDVAEAPLKVARLLGLSNASFLKVPGENLQFPAQTFDSAFCYDVFSNFPNFAAGESIIEEMLRVVKPGGKVLIGSIPDRDKIELVQKIAGELASGFRQQAQRPPIAAIVKRSVEPNWLTRLAQYFGLNYAGRKNSTEVKPEIVNYYFDRNDFLAFGERLRVDTQIFDIHSLNPYLGTRFNAVFIAR